MCTLHSMDVLLKIQEWTEAHSTHMTNARKNREREIYFYHGNGKWNGCYNMNHNDGIEILVLGMAIFAAIKKFNIL